MASTIADRSAGFAPDFVSSSDSLTSIMASIGFDSPSRRSASFDESMESIEEKSCAAFFVLLDCRCPIR